MSLPEPCPSCGGTHVVVLQSRRLGYGRYRRMECSACEYRWTHREQGEHGMGTLLQPRHQCPECKSRDAAVRESRVTDYGRRQRVACHSCGHRWTVKTVANVSARPMLLRESGRLTEDEIGLILTSVRSIRRLATKLRVSPETVRNVQIGKIHGQVLPDLPRRQRSERRRSCTSCRFWDEQSVRPCRLGWPDPETDGPGYARECGDYEKL